jgi:hypothetical protein
LVCLFRRVEQFVGRQLIEPAPASTAHHDADPDPRIDTCLLRRIDQGLGLLSFAYPIDQIYRGHHCGGVERITPISATGSIFEYTSSTAIHNRKRRIGLFGRATD